MKWLSVLFFLMLTFGLNAAVVVNNNVEQTSLTQTQLRNIFTMRQIRWADGSPIYVLVLPSAHPLHQRFSREQLGLFPYQLINIWDRQSFSGVSNRPHQVASEAQMLKMLQQIPGSIGYIESFTPELGVKEMLIE